MPELVPVLEFLHELDSAGVKADYQDVLDRPMEYWRQLPSRRRAAFLERLHLNPDETKILDLTVVKRRGHPPLAENLFMRFHVEEKKSFAHSLRKTKNNLLFEGLVGRKVDDPGKVRVGDTEALTVPESVFREASLGDRRRTVLSLLDSVWGGEPYSIERDGPLCTFEPIRGFQEIERYWVEDQFAIVVILQNPENQLVYHVEEPSLTQMEKKLLITLNERLKDVLICDLDTIEGDRHVFLADKALELLRLYRYRVDRRTAYKLGYYFLRNYLGFGRLDPIMHDTAIEDVSCNGPHIPLYVVHSRHQNLRTNVVFGELELNSYTIKLTQRGGKLLSMAEPLVDATLPDGSRIQASLGRTVTSRGSAFTIRKFRADPLTCVDLIRSGTHTSATMAFLWLVVEAQRSVVVMGATASGKTTTLNCLSQFIPPAKKIVTIEDTREITLNHENWLSATTREAFSGTEHGAITMYDLLRAALRQRPEYIIVGEIRGAEGLTLFQAMSTGHTCYSTMHAGSVENAVYRLENAPISVPRVMITSLDYFLLQGQVDVKGRHARRMLSLTEVNGMDPASRNLRMNEIFRWDGATDGFESITTSAIMEEVRKKRGWTRARLEEELIARQKVLEGLVARGERHYLQVAKAISEFYSSRERPRATTIPVKDLSPATPLGSAGSFTIPALPEAAVAPMAVAGAGGARAPAPSDLRLSREAFEERPRDVFPAREPSTAGSPAETLSATPVPVRAVVPEEAPQAREPAMGEKETRTGPLFIPKRFLRKVTSFRKNPAVKKRRGRKGKGGRLW